MGGEVVGDRGGFGGIVAAGPSGRTASSRRSLAALRPLAGELEFAAGAVGLAEHGRFLELVEGVGGGDRYDQDSFASEPGDLVHLVVADLGGDSDALRLRR